MFALLRGDREDKKSPTDDHKIGVVSGPRVCIGDGHPIKPDDDGQ